MDEIMHLEISPGTITTKPCTKCGKEAFTFDTVALRDKGETWYVSWAGTITRCGTCEGA